ncbi:NAD(P)/FAD-dependent oxidoreductase [Streptomyces sp. IB2014 016-6]|uniref:NAD(P)/FAD-dependent oxidoreductase n=1 Tax=Streptomyces sp. IB2014 016-6 TaxID=2517818 RepID=UPI0011C72C3E|nr:NAD(P)/FAD-dependent oxidoreductase [Streptomyces sp. IB2014 016-6]TXL88665.1 NAD(P)/FAD-dependent oxidoreductase [Streptomyces sp. IB2014 016-6]
MIDVLIAGGGPAGLAAGIHAARAGLRAVVVEPRTAPVDKACGEGIMPGGVAALSAMGVEVSGRELRGIRYRDGARDAEAWFRDGTGLGVRRTELHAALRRRADALGVETVRGKVGEVWQGTDRVVAGGRTARWLIAADGLHSPIRRALGLDLPDRAPARYGLRRHFRVGPWSDFVEVHWSRHGEAYVTPLGDALVGVAVLSRERCGYAEHLARFPELAPLLGERAASGVRGAGPLRQRVSRPLAGRVLLVGDAAGYVDALTGEGIALALSTAGAAVRALAEGRPGTYPAAWSKLTRRHRVLTEGLLSVTRSPRAARLIVPAAARLPAVFTAAVHALQ